MPYTSLHTGNEIDASVSSSPAVRGSQTLSTTTSISADFYTTYIDASSAITLTLPTPVDGTIIQLIRIDSSMFQVLIGGFGAGIPSYPIYKQETFSLIAHNDRWWFT